MGITATQVKELRERTGAGMMECKKVLVETDGDIEAAIEAMRKSGQAKADKKAGRTAAEGLVYILTSADSKEALLIEVNCETDFVARDENFKNFVTEAAKVALQQKTDDVEKLMTLDVSGQTLDALRQSLVLKLGENIKIRRLHYLSSEGVIGQYIHGNRIAVVVSINNSDIDLAKDLAMHVAANNPAVINPEEVNQDDLAKEREIFAAQAKESGKPEEIIDKMVEGRIRKYVDEVTLLGQPFVKDPSIKIAQLVKDKNATVLQFLRYQVGEGIEKKESNFAKEVMEQVRG